jgi:acylphosphatase
MAQDPRRLYENFDVRIERVGESYLTRVSAASSGEGEAIAELSASVDQLDEFLRKVGCARRRPRGPADTRLSEAKKFGRSLFEAVFRGEALSCLQTSLGNASARGVGMRIRLRLAGVPELSDIPWEFLYSETTRTFLSQRWRGRLVSADKPGAILHDQRSLRLVVLNACEGARSDVHDPFSGTAQTLVRHGIPAVLAMQFEITDDAAINFTSGFYSSVAVGDPIDAALTYTRLRLFALQDDGVEWATPVLYLRATDGRIFDVAQTLPVIDKQKEFLIQNSNSVARSPEQEPTPKPLSPVRDKRDDGKRAVIGTVTANDGEVGFRAMLMKQAIEYNLAGSAKNDENKLVQFTLQGDTKRIYAVIATLNEGTTSLKIEVTTSSTAVDRALSTFTVSNWTSLSRNITTPYTLVFKLRADDKVISRTKARNVWYDILATTLKAGDLKKLDYEGQ